MSMGLTTLKSLVRGTHLEPLNVPGCSVITAVVIVQKTQLKEVKSGFLALLTLVSAV